MFKVSKTLIDEPVDFNECIIEQDGKGNISMSMKKYMQTIKPIAITRTRRKELTEKLTNEE